MLLKNVSVHIKPSSGSHLQRLAKITYLVLMYQYLCCQCYGGIYAAITLTTSILVHWYQICNFS
jgi:hypothetical protein